MAILSISSDCSLNQLLNKAVGAIVAHLIHCLYYHRAVGFLVLYQNNAVLDVAST